MLLFGVAYGEFAAWSFPIMLCFFCNKYWWAMALAWACRRNCCSLLGGIVLMSVLTSENDWTWTISFLIFDWLLRRPWLPVRVVVGTKNWEFSLVTSSGCFSPCCNVGTSARCKEILRSGLTRDLEWIPTLVASVAEYLREFCFLANLFSATDIDSWLSCLPNTGRGSV